MAVWAQWAAHVAAARSAWQTQEYAAHLQQLSCVLDARLLGGTDGAATLANVVQCHVLCQGWGQCVTT